MSDSDFDHPPVQVDDDEVLSHMPEASSPDGADAADADDVLNDATSGSETVKDE